MNPGHMKLGLKAISYGIEKIPDSAWEAIPAFRTKVHNEKNKITGHEDHQDSKKPSRHRSHRDSDTRSRKDSDRRSSRSSDSGYKPQYQKPSDDYYVNSQYSTDPRDSNRNNSVNAGHGSNRPQFIDPFEEDQARGAPQDATQLHYQNTYQPPVQNRNTYQPPNQNTAQPSVINEPYWLQQEKQWQQPDSTSQRSRSPGDQQMQSSDTYLPPPPPQGGSHRYNPADYQPRNDDGYDGGRQGGQQYLTAPTRQGGRSSSAGPPQRYGGYDDDYDNDRDYDDRVARRSSSRKKRESRDGSNERGGPRGFVDKNFDKSDKGLQYGAIGAVAGGFIGHKFGKGPLATLAGAVVGGVGANAFEARESRHKGRDHEKSHKYRSRSQDQPYPRDRSASRGARDDDYASSSRRSGYDRDDSYYSGREDDYSDDDRRRGGERRASSRRRSGGRDRDYDDRDYR